MADLEITYLNVGQGDCTLIKSPPVADDDLFTGGFVPDDRCMRIMIDCGSSGGPGMPADLRLQQQIDALNAKKAKGHFGKMRTSKQKTGRYHPYRGDDDEKESDPDQDEIEKLKKQQYSVDAAIENAMLGFLPIDKGVQVKFIDLLILTHHDQDHYNKIAMLAKKGLTFGKIYYSGALEPYYPISQTLINQYPPMEDKNCVSITINGQGAHQKPIEKKEIYGTENVDAPFPLITDAANNFFVEILASNVHLQNAPSFDASGGGRPPAEYKNFIFPTSSGDINARSIVTMIRYKNQKILIMGDATVETEAFLIKKYAPLAADMGLNVTVLRAGHHGSDTSSSDDFVKKTKPKTVLISCAYTNTYGLPNTTIMARFDAALTDEDEDEDEHEISSYANMFTAIAIGKSKKAIWQTWSLHANGTEHVVYKGG